MEDSELVADYPSVKINDFMGGDMTLRRIESTRGVDTGGVYRSSVTVEQSWLHDSTHYDQDPSHADNQSHNDGIQVHGGSNYRFVGNTITGHNNAAIMVNQAVSHTSDLLIDRNWLDGGGCSINIAAANQYGTSQLTVTNNRFGRSQHFANCAIIVSFTQNALTQSGNVWEATGDAVALSRGS
ncbi:MAG: right-handed parallel beta-helix repeat-containing protein [Thermoleophilia bacterium]|nr:right-handed parallel beta-helix repeat-containing protein [Thermoleophilia bacterium]